MSKSWRYSDDVMFFATFEVFNMHLFYYQYVFERAHQEEPKPEKKFLHITKIKWNMAFLNMKNNSAKYGVLPLRKIPKLEP